MKLDLRLPIGLMFSIIGLLLVVFGLVSDTAIYERSLGVNVNLWWGVVLVVFGLTMLGLAMRGGGRRLGSGREKTVITSEARDLAGRDRSMPGQDPSPSLGMTSTSRTHPASPAARSPASGTSPPPPPAPRPPSPSPAAPLPPPSAAPDAAAPVPPAPARHPASSASPRRAPARWRGRSPIAGPGRSRPGCWRCRPRWRRGWRRAARAPPVTPKATFSQASGTTVPCASRSEAWQKRTSLRSRSRGRPERSTARGQAVDRRPACAPRAGRRGGPATYPTASSVPGRNSPSRKVNGGWASRVLMRSRSGLCRSSRRARRGCSSTSSQLLNTRTSVLEAGRPVAGDEDHRARDAAGRWLRKKW